MSKLVSRLNSKEMRDYFMRYVVLAEYGAPCNWLCFGSTVSVEMHATGPKDAIPTCHSCSYTAAVFPAFLGTDSQLGASAGSFG